MSRMKRNTKSLLDREHVLRDELKRVRQQLRAAEDAARQAWRARVGELAEKFGIAHVSDTVLAAEFKRIAAEHPAPAATESHADDADDTAETGEVAQTPAGGAAQAEPETERAAESAEAGGETKRWKWK